MSSITPPPPLFSAVSRRSLLFSTTLSAVSPTSPVDTTITDRIFLDFAVCPTYFRSADSIAANSSPPCADSTPLGRLVIGLYGRHVPLTVSTFKLMCASSSYRNTPVHKILPGRFFLAGRQGRRGGESGGQQQRSQISNLPQNIETVDSRAFSLTHSRAGLVSLCLSENDDDEDVRLDPDYRNVEFLITTGPGPCPQLDGRNIVFGTVLQGLDVVTNIASIPTFQASERIKQFNDLAEFLGDERAQNARTLWDKPLRTVYISECGDLKVANPSFSPTLP